MSDLVEQLRAQAAELRAEEPSTVAYPGGAIRFDWQRDWFVSLADLIDGMLELNSRTIQDPEPDLRTLTPDQAYTLGGNNVMYEALPLLHAHVSTVLSGCTQTAREAQ